MAGSRLVSCALCAISLGLVAAPVASADPFEQIFHDYQRTGKIDPCKYSRQDLKNALGEVPNDIEAYAPDFPNALEAAIEQRAGGGCAKHPQQSTPAAAATPAPTNTAPPAAGTPATPPTATTPAPTPDLEPARAASDKAIARTAKTRRVSDASAPAPVIGLAVLAALIALAALVYGLARWLAWDPRWARGMRHAVGEAGWRASASWAEFTDWVRLGR